jgi:hypothetical protein
MILVLKKNGLHSLMLVQSAKKDKTTPKPGEAQQVEPDVGE